MLQVSVPNRWSMANVVFVCATVGLLSGFALRTDGWVSRQTDEQSAQTTLETRTVSVRINRPFAEVYEFLVRPENWNQWATGLGKSIQKRPEGWAAETQEGQIKVRFTPRNSFGIVDHYVVRKTGAEVYVPMRLIANGQGCELLFTLFREPGMSDDKYAGDMDFVKKDLDGLKKLLEQR